MFAARNSEIENRETRFNRGESDDTIHEMAITIIAFLILGVSHCVKIDLYAARQPTVGH